MEGGGNAKFLAFFTGGLAFISCLVTTAYPEWIKNSQQSSEQFLRNTYIYNGIWWRCNSKEPGTFQCDHYDTSILGLSSDIQACRALMCIATIFSFVGVLTSLLSLECTTIVESESKAKNNISLVAGICFITTAQLQAQRSLMVIAVVISFIGLVIGIISLRCTTMVENDSKKKSGIGIGAGICFLIAALTCGVAVSWYAWRVTYEYYSPYYQEREYTYEFGACLYIGWFATLLGAATLITTIWFGINVHNQYYDPMHKNDSFKYEYGSCLYVGWVAGALTFIAGLILTIGACRNMRSDNRDTYETSKAYVYNPPTSTTTKANGTKAEYV